MITRSLSTFTRLLVIVNAIAFGLTLLLAILAPWSTAMWITLILFGATMLAQVSLYLHVIIARRIARRDGKRTV